MSFGDDPAAAAAAVGRARSDDVSAVAFPIAPWKNDWRPAMSDESVFVRRAEMTFRADARR